VLTAIFTPSDGGSLRRFNIGSTLHAQCRAWPTAFDRTAPNYRLELTVNDKVPCIWPSTAAAQSWTLGYRTLKDWISARNYAH
jgi:hypothetical protein